MTTTEENVYTKEVNYVQLYMLSELKTHAGVRPCSIGISVSYE